MLLRGMMCAVVPAGSDGADGSFPARDCPLDRDVARGNFLVGMAVWREHSGRGARMFSRRILSAADFRHRHRDAGRSRAEPDRGCDRVAAGSHWGEPAAPAEIKPAVVDRSQWTIYVAIAISGACALGGEVVWTRLMGMLFGATVYVFSIILAVFLIGLALGSASGAMLIRSLPPGVKNARLALGWCQAVAALTLAIAWTAYMIADSLPFLPVNSLLSSSPWYTFQVDLVRCLWAVLPPTILWGASFPLALAAVAGHQAKIRAGWWAESTRPIHSARSWGHYR